MTLKGTKSEGNIQTAFAGESQARNRYTYFAQVARQEGNEETAALFEKMAENEMNHAKVWFKLLNDGLGTTEQGLIEASKGEGEEWVSMYPQFAKDARAEGLEELALMFERVATVERDHERRFLEELIRIKSGGSRIAVAAETKKMAQQCTFCGYTHFLENGPSPYACPLCAALGAFEAVEI